MYKLEIETDSDNTIELKFKTILELKLYVDQMYREYKEYANEINKRVIRILE